MLKYGKAEIQAVATVLDQEHETVEDAAIACLEAMEAIFENRAKFVVVGQVVETKAEGRLDPSAPEAVKVSLGWYSTEGAARSASESLWTNTASGDVLHTWVLPVFHGTPAKWHGTQREKYQQAEMKAEAAQQDRLASSIERYQFESRKAVWESLSEDEREWHPNLRAYEGTWAQFQKERKAA